MKPSPSLFPWPWSLLLLGILGAVLARPVAAGERVLRDQLARMTAALQALTYSGTLVYVYEDGLDTLRIVHRVEEGRAHEFLESLDGPVRTLTREHDRVTGQLTEGQPISLHGRGLGTAPLVAKRLDPEALAPHYRLHSLGNGRVAGRATEVIGILPRDRLRYGYRFHLDRQTGLPLRSDLLDPDARPIEQVVFTSLEIEDSAATWTPPPRQPPAPPDLGPWRFTQLPSGFAVIFTDHTGGGLGQALAHLVLSDGLAAVSVYIEPGEEAGLDGVSRIGAVHAVGGRVAGRQVTVVGEVPRGTAQAVFRALVFVGGGRG